MNNSLSKSQRMLGWRLCTAVVAILTVLCMSPLVLRHGQWWPAIAGVPLTLWSGWLIYILVFLCTVAGAWFYPFYEKQE